MMTDNVWFVQIIGKLYYSMSFTDKYGHTVSAGKKYMLGHF